MIDNALQQLIRHIAQPPFIARMRIIEKLIQGGFIQRVAHIVLVLFQPNMKNPAGAGL
jgi:hypothetical protein